jgi:hypothetical protein
MNEFLSSIGLLSISLFILYVMKKVNEYFYFKKIDNNESYNFDKEDDEY